MYRVWLRQDQGLARDGTVFLGEGSVQLGPN